MPMWARLVTLMRSAPGAASVAQCWRVWEARRVQSGEKNEDMFIAAGLPGLVAPGGMRGYVATRHEGSCHRVKKVLASVPNKLSV